MINLKNRALTHFEGLLNAAEVISGMYGQVQPLLDTPPKHWDKKALESFNAQDFTQNYYKARRQIVEPSNIPNLPEDAMLVSAIALFGITTQQLDGIDGFLRFLTSISGHEVPNLPPLPEHVSDQPSHPSNAKTNSSEGRSLSGFLGNIVKGTASSKAVSNNQKPSEVAHLPTAPVAEAENSQTPPDEDVASIVSVQDTDTHSRPSVEKAETEQEEAIKETSSSIATPPKADTESSETKIEPEPEPELKNVEPAEAPTIEKTQDEKASVETTTISPTAKAETKIETATITEEKTVPSSEEQSSTNLLAGFKPGPRRRGRPRTPTSNSSAGTAHQIKEKQPEMAAETPTEIKPVHKPVEKEKELPNWNNIGSDAYDDDIPF